VKWRVARFAPPPIVDVKPLAGGLHVTEASKHHNRVNAFLRSAMPRFEKKRCLSASPVIIAASLHQMAEKDDPQVAPETLRLPDAVHADFREKLSLYREANVLLALMDRVSPSSDVRDPLFEPVLGKYERIIFGKLSDDPIIRLARGQSVMAALRDLKFLIHPPMGNKYDLARDWSRNWFAAIGHNEMNPVRLEKFSWFWSSDYIAVQKVLQAAIATRI
jgi:hypothetical protein